MEPLDKEKNITSERKISHIEICINKEVEVKNSIMSLDDVHLVHRAINNLDFDEIDTSVKIFNKKLDIPLICAALTGGHRDVQYINEIIAKASQKYKFGLGIGSERAAIEKEDKNILKSFQIVRDIAKDTLILGNLGIAQFSNKNSYKFGKEEVLKAINLIKADAIAIHVNPAQEVIQPEGDIYFKGAFENITKISKEIDTPIILKEVGCGFSKEDIEKIEREGEEIAGIDVGGKGGTSWIAVETLRAKESNKSLQYEVGKTFLNWGIPTHISVIEARKVTNKIIIATGGVRTGLDAAKLIALGADIVGIALPFLKCAYKGEEEVEFFVKKFLYELKVAMFLLGVNSIEKLKKVPVIITGATLEWLKQRQIK